MKNISVWLVIGFVFVANINILAQLSGSVGYSWFFDDNPQRTTLRESEFVNSAKSDFSYKLFDKELYLNYSGNYNSFRTISDRTFQMHSFGLNYALNTTDLEDENIFAGISYSLKKGTGDFAYYDYSQAIGFVNGKFPIDETLFLQGALNTSYKKFPSLNSLLHFENFASSQISKFFSSGTGVFIEAGIGLMNYSFNNVTTTETATGMQSGKMNSKNTKSFSVAQFRSMAKVSQSVFESTGINFHYLYRQNIKDNKGMFVSADYIYSGDDELWDDPYGFSSNELGSEFTQKMPYEITFKISAQYDNRHYTNNLADSLNLTQRVDERFSFWGGISKSFTELPLIGSLELSIEYMFINNKSNSALFDYKNNMLMFGASVNF